MRILTFPKSQLVGSSLEAKLARRPGLINIQAWRGFRTQLLLAQPREVFDR